MKRRGLNFLTEQAVENLDEDMIQTIEQEVDNVAPRIIGFLALNSNCDITSLRKEMVDYCHDF